MAHKQSKCTVPRYYTKCVDVLYKNMSIILAREKDFEAFKLLTLLRRSTKTNGSCFALYDHKLSLSLIYISQKMTPHR